MSQPVSSAQELSNIYQATRTRVGEKGTMHIGDVLHTLRLKPGLEVGNIDAVVKKFKEVTTQDDGAKEVIALGNILLSNSAFALSESQRKVIRTALAVLQGEAAPNALKLWFDAKIETIKLFCQGLSFKKRQKVLNSVLNMYQKLAEPWKRDGNALFNLNHITARCRAVAQCKKSILDAQLPRDVQEDILRLFNWRILPYTAFENPLDQMSAIVSKAVCDFVGASQLSVATRRHVQNIFEFMESLFKAPVAQKAGKKTALEEEVTSFLDKRLDVASSRLKGAIEFYTTQASRVSTKTLVGFTEALRKSCQEYLDNPQNIEEYFITEKGRS